MNFLFLSNMTGILLLAILVLFILVLFIVAVFNANHNYPTWKGIIISSIFGMLPLYLILCFIGWMGHEKQQEEKIQ